MRYLVELALVIVVVMTVYMLLNYLFINKKKK